MSDFDDFDFEFEEEDQNVKEIKNENVNTSVNKNHLKWNRESDDRFYSLDDIIFPPAFKNLKKLWDSIIQLCDQHNSKLMEIEIECKLTDEGKTMFKQAFLTCRIEKIFGETQNDTEDKLLVNLKVYTDTIHEIEINGAQRIVFEFNVLSLNEEECERFQDLCHINKMNESYADKIICKICFRNGADCTCDGKSEKGYNIYDFFQTNNGLCFLCNRELPVNPARSRRYFKECQHEFHAVCIIKNCIK